MEVYIAIIGASSALLGTIVGGVISYFTVRYTATQQHKHEQKMREIEKREHLYSDFLAESSRLGLLSVREKINDATIFTHLASLLSQIRIIASDEVATAASDVARLVLKNFQDDEPKKKAGEGENQTSKKSSLKFTEVAKKELDELKAKI